MAGSVSLLSRGVARSVDLVLALAMAEAIPMAGWLGGMLYLLAADGVSGGQSVGKRLLGLRVIGREGAWCSLEESMLRNLVFALALMLWKLPVVGWAVLAAAIVLESVIIIGSADALRMGDELARTRVVPEGWTSVAPKEGGNSETEAVPDTPPDTELETVQETVADNLTNTINKEERAH